MNKLIFIFSILFILSLSFATALTYPANKKIDFKIFSNESACNLTLSNSTVNIISNEVMSVNTDTQVANYTISSLPFGSYQYFSNCGHGEFYITSNGQETNYNYLIATVVLIIIFMSFGVFIYQDKKKMDDEKYWNMIFNKWQKKNYIKFSGLVVWYNLKRNAYALYYLIGLTIIFMLGDIAAFYNLALLPLIGILLNLYSWGTVIIAMVIFGNIQEWIFEWKEKLEQIKWGELTYDK